MSNQFITETEARRYTGMSKDTLHDWRIKGSTKGIKLPYYSMGRKIFYKKEEIDNFIEQHRVHTEVSI